MDRNSVIGLILLMLLGGGYIFYSTYQKNQYNEWRAQQVADSLEKNKLVIAEMEANAPKTADTLVQDTAQVVSAFHGKKEIREVSNGLLTFGISTKGGTPEFIRLDTFKSYPRKADKDLFFFNDAANNLNISLPTSTGSINTNELYYQPVVTGLPDGSQQVTMTAEVGNGQKVIYEYVLQPNSYIVKSGIRLIGFQSELSKAGAALPLQWNVKTARTEKNVNNERMSFQVHFGEVKDGHDYYTLRSTANKELKDAIKWFGVRSQFFHTTIMADNQFSHASFNGVVPADNTDTGYVAVNATQLYMPVTPSNDFSFGYSWIVSPNEYKLLKTFGHEMEDMIQLGLGPFTFVKYISKWFIIPLFDFLSKFISNGGLIIIVMTLVIRLLLSFFSYKSFLSQAKMRVLKPELDALRAKHEGDQQQMGMEQMKLYRTAGVNPMGGCLPMLLQMPFLLSMYYYMPTELSFRQQSFWWADDLSAYDSILNLGFRIPWYGDHVSLFTLLMAGTTIFLTLYNRNNTAAAGGEMANNPVIKYMPYIMPILFLGWFNGMAAALTFYYTCSNLISILQQFIIQKFFIDDKKILQRIEANKLNPKNQTSKWQDRLQQMQKMQEERAKQNKK